MKTLEQQLQASVELLECVVPRAKLPTAEALAEVHSQLTRQRAKAIAGFEARFWALVDKRGPDECWNWKTRGHSFGYGKLHRADENGSREVLAHRASWELANGPITGGLHVLHKCDNPRCVNPAHLFLGTQTENNADRARKGRTVIPHRRGEENNKAKLKAEQVLEIRRRYEAGGISIRQLAREYGVTFAPIQLILSGKTWRHL